MNNMDDLEGLSGIRDAFDWVTRNGPDQTDADGAVLDDISVGGVVHEKSQDSLVAYNVEKEDIAEDMIQTEADNNNVETELVAVDAIHTEEDAVSENAAQEVPDDDLGASAENEFLENLTTEGQAPRGDIQCESDEELELAVERHGSQDSARSNAGLTLQPTQIMVELPLLAQSLLDDYSTVVSEVVDHIRGEEQSFGSYHVEFTDGRVETISYDHLLDLNNGQSALDDFLNGANMGENSRKRKFGEHDWGSDSGSEIEENQADGMEIDGADSDESVKQFPRRSSRRASRKPKIVITRRQSLEHSDEEIGRPSRSARSLRPRASIPSYYGPDPSREVPEGRDEVGDDDFRPVISDIAPPKRGRRPTRGSARRLTPGRQRPSGGGSDIEFEAPRRSSRATKNLQRMNDEYDSDEDFESMAVVKERGAPKVVPVKEIFHPIKPESPFAVAHMQKCHVCAGSQQRGQLIYCQGCSLTFHKGCIGLRSSREHLATKVDKDSFVLQCKFCIGVYTSRDDIAPRYDMCQQCKGPGVSCSAFTTKRTARQEEKLREENDGVDPVTPVAPSLINNSDNVLFRCQSCHRGWHQDHLPVPDGIQSDIDGYSKKWRCSECLSVTHKIHRLVAWRPTEKHLPVKGQQPPSWHVVPDDEKEYLIKWETKSYAHCTWLPGAWVYGVAASHSRKAFGKRDLEQSMLKMTKEDAIPEEFLAPDIILVAKMDHSAPNHHSKEDMLANIIYVRRIFVKFQGLGYEDVVWDTPPMPDNSALYTAFVDAYNEYVNGKYFEAGSQTTIRRRVEEFKNQEFTPLDAQPKGIRRGKLMGYQLEGLNWLLENYHHGRSVVLADEMGLGKTVQVVSLVTSLVQDSPKCWPFLIVVPNATCPNWRREFRQWVPDLRVVAYHGGKESQQLTYRYELFPEHGGAMRAHAVIMSYDSAQDPRTAALFKSVRWAGLIVDEGQRLKNDQNLLYQALRGMKIPFRLLLTGTPLQNNKRELFNLIQFIDTKQDAAKLDAEFEVLDKETLPQLHDKIRPYFLRRTKAGVLKFLPPMAQIIVPVTMTVVQEKLAKSIMSKNPELIKAIFAESKLKKKNYDRGSLNNILMQLRKCLCHPFMYSENIEEKHHDPVVMFRNLIEASAKLLLLELMLPKLKERGHRVLIFSQFLQQLDIIEDFLIGIGLDYRRLDGGMSSLEKQKRIDAFNQPDSPLFAFLLSTRAGGVGINLATADTVIIMDPDFNPHQDLQALSRAHRIGQKNKVLCFQFMTKDTVEERIVQVGRGKMALDHALIESMDDDELEGADLESILKHGASALFNDNYQKTKIQYTPAMVDDLLDRSQIEQASVEENPSGETPFAYARVWDSDKVGFDTLPTAEAEAPVPIDSGVWDKIIAQREEEARRNAEANREVLGRGGRRRMKIDYNVKNGAQREAADRGTSSDSDEFSGGDSSSESEDDALGKEEQEAGHHELAEQTNTAQRPAQVDRTQVTAIPSRRKGPIKVTFAQNSPGVVGAQPRGRVPEGTNAASDQANQQRRQPIYVTSMKKQVLGTEPLPPQTSLVPNEFWRYVSRLGSEVEVRVAIDEVARNKEQRIVKQIEQARFSRTPQPKEQQGSYSMNRIWNVQHSSTSSPDNTSLSSRGSLQLDGMSSSTTTSQHTSSSSRASVGSNFEPLPAGVGFQNYAFEGSVSNAYSYYLDRGNGQFTRLIPADMLPPMKGVPSREEEHDGMVILQPIERLHLQSAKDSHQVAASKQPSPLPDNLQNQIDCIVATSPKSTRRVKIYCDKWIHEGVCAFTQQGCKFKHEMPRDEATQRSLGLFHGFPAWWKKRAEEQNSPRRGLDAASQSTSPARLGSAAPQLGNNDPSQGRSHHSGTSLEQQRILPPNDHSYAQNNFATAPNHWRASGSQWMQNGIVPFVRGPRRAY